MITLVKGKKPAILTDKENEWTQQLMVFVVNGEKIPKHIMGRYRHPDIKKALLDETNYKCAYCESKITHIDYGDVEHIEPKSSNRGKTYSWYNLTIGCSICNQNKDVYFDLDLPLLNPYTDQPELKIVFAGAYCLCAKGNENAEITIKQLELNRPALYEKRTERLRNLDPLIKQYERSTNQNLKRLLLKDILAETTPDKEFSAMTTHLLNQLKITG